MSANGGFPPIKKIIDKTEKKEEIQLKKERLYNAPKENLDIKHILASSVVKPMIQVNKNELDIIDSL